MSSGICSSTSFTLFLGVVITSLYFTPCCILLLLASSHPCSLVSSSLPVIAHIFAHCLERDVAMLVSGFPASSCTVLLVYIGKTYHTFAHRVVLPHAVCSARSSWRSLTPSLHRSALLSGHKGISLRSCRQAKSGFLIFVPKTGMPLH